MQYIGIVHYRTVVCGFDTKTGLFYWATGVDWLFMF
jgi:hypothetical protein